MKFQHQEVVLNLADTLQAIIALELVTSMLIGCTHRSAVLHYRTRLLMNDYEPLD